MSYIKRFLTWVVNAIRSQISPRVQFPDHDAKHLQAFSAPKPIPITSSDVARFKRYQAPLFPAEQARDSKPTGSQRKERRRAKSAIDDKYHYRDRLGSMNPGDTVGITAYKKDQVDRLRRLFSWFMHDRFGAGSYETAVVLKNKDTDRYKIYITRLK